MLGQGNLSAESYIWATVRGIRSTGTSDHPSRHFVDVEVGVCCGSIRSVNRHSHLRLSPQPVRRSTGIKRWPIQRAVRAWIAWIALLAPVSAAQTLDCAECHDQPHIIVGTAHASVGCLTCHPHHNQFPHPQGIAKPTCTECHRDVAAQNRLGIHGRARAQGNQAAPDCVVCHGNVHQVQKVGTEAFRKSVPSICGMCHDQIYAKYEQSVHGKAASAGIVAAPVCSTCHGEHDIQPPTASTSPVNPLHIPQTCGRCHGNVALAREFNLPTNIMVSYQDSFHGLALRQARRRWRTVPRVMACMKFSLPPTRARLSILRISREPVANATRVLERALLSDAFTGLDGLSHR